MITPQNEWKELLTRLKEEGGTLYVAGGSDLGKSSFCRYIRGELSERSVGYLDLDTGQSTVGPPATLGLAVYRGKKRDPDSVHIRFAGAISPRGHFIQFLSGAKRLLEKAEALGLETTLIDSPGYIRGSIATEFHFQMIDLLRPDHIVAFQKKHELEALLANFRKDPCTEIHRFPAPPEAMPRSGSYRRRYREERFREYFSGAVSHRLSLTKVGLHGDLPRSGDAGGWQNLLIALCNADNSVITLGIIRDYDPVRRIITIRSPPFERQEVASVHVGSERIEYLWQ